MPMPIVEFLALCERKLAETRDPAHAPMHLDPTHARTYQQARAELLLWVLEQLG
jgi:hypothetical protein